MWLRSSLSPISCYNAGTPAGSELATATGAEGTSSAAPGWGGGLPDTVRLPTPVWRAIKWWAGLTYAFVVLASAGLHHTRWGFGLGSNGDGDLVLAAAGLLALLWRARYPEAVVVFMTVLLVTWAAVPAPNDGVVFTLLAIAIYSLVVRRPPRRALALSVASWVVVSVVGLVAGGPLVAPLAPNLVFLVAAIACALVISSQRALLAAAQERAAQAERERNFHAAQAVAEERVRIARELHDVVAHHVSLLVVQAGAVREALPPGHEGREVLNSMIQGGRQAMNELRAMLSALREPGTGEAPLAPLTGNGAAAAAAALAGGGASAGLPRSPQPSLQDVGALVDRAGTAGLPVRLELTGESLVPPPAVTLAAYRITQEALTNVVKHAPGANTLVAIDCGSEGVSVRVRNERAVVPVAAVPGHHGQGLVGMAERAAHCHGWVTARPEGEGFTVEAWLPVTNQ